MSLRYFHWQFHFQLQQLRLSEGLLLQLDSSQFLICPSPPPFLISCHCDTWWGGFWPTGCLSSDISNWGEPRHTRQEGATPHHLQPGLHFEQSWSSILRARHRKHSFYTPTVGCRLYDFKPAAAEKKFKQTLLVLGPFLGVPMYIPQWSTVSGLFGTGRFLRRLTAVILTSRSIFHSHIC